MKKGLSLIAIVIAIAIVIVLTTTVIVEYRNVVIKAKKTDLASDFYAMNKLVSDYEFMNSSYPVITSSEYIVDLNSIPDENAKVQFSAEPGYSEGKVELQYIDYNKLSTEKLTRGMQQNGINDRYAMSVWTKRIYYLKGETIGNKVYYTLTNELMKLLDISYVK